MISEIKDKCRVGITARNQTNNNTGTASLLLDYLLRQFLDFEKNILKEVINNDPQLYVINSDPTFSGKLTAIVRTVITLEQRSKKPILDYLFMGEGRISGD